MTQIWCAPQCDADHPAEGRCNGGAVWRIRIHSTDDPHGPDDTVWRVLCRDHALRWLKWVLDMETAGDGTWCNVCNAMIPAGSWLIEDSCIDPDEDPIGWVEWLATQEGER